MLEATRYTLPTYDLSRPWPELEAQYDEQDKAYNREKERLRMAINRAGKETEKRKILSCQREEILAAKKAARIHFSQLERGSKRPPGITSWEHYRQSSAVPVLLDKTTNLLDVFAPSAKIKRDHRWESLDRVREFFESIDGYSGLRKKILKGDPKTAHSAFGGISLDLRCTSGQSIFETIQWSITGVRKPLISSQDVVGLLDDALHEIPGLADRRKVSVEMLVPEASGADGGPWHSDHPMSSDEINVIFVLKKGSLCTVSCKQRESITIEALLQLRFPKGASSQLVQEFRTNKKLQEIVRYWGALLFPLGVECQQGQRLQKGTIIAVKAGCIHRIPSTQSEETARVVILCTLASRKDEHFLDCCWSRERAFLSVFDLLARSPSVEMDDAIVFGEEYLNALLENEKYGRKTDLTIESIATDELVQCQNKFLAACREIKQLKERREWGSIGESLKVGAAKDGLLKCLRKGKVLKET